MTRLEEMHWIEDILLDLKYNYNNHNTTVLEDILNILNYKIECENKQHKPFAVESEALI